MLDVDELVGRIVDTSECKTIQVYPYLPLSDCYSAFDEAVGTVNTRSSTILQPDGGIFYNDTIPVLFLHRIDLSEIVNSEEEGSYYAECAMLQRAAEMLFAPYSIFPVLFIIQGGSPAFWKYIEILQLGRSTNQNIAKVYGHSIPTVISYTTMDAACSVAQQMIKDAIELTKIPTAER